MEEYVSNSHKSKKENLELQTGEKRVKGGVISGSAKIKKKSELRKFTDIFIADDIANVKSYIFMDVLIPSIKKAISDIVTNGIDMILYGETGRSKKTSNASKISYRSYYENPSDSDRRRNGIVAAKNAFDYDDILFTTRGDAEIVLDAMNDIISQYGVVSVGDLYDLANVQTNNYTVNRYGWTDIFGCRPVRVPDGYILKLPRPMPIKQGG